MAEAVEVEELADTERGAGGFGSTGVSATSEEANKKQTKHLFFKVIIKRKVPDAKLLHTNLQRQTIKGPSKKLRAVLTKQFEHW
jgi:hypothetical protein